MDISNSLCQLDLIDNSLVPHNVLAVLLLIPNTRPNSPSNNSRAPRKDRLHSSHPNKGDTLSNTHRPRNKADTRSSIRHHLSKVAIRLLNKADIRLLVVEVPPPPGPPQQPGWSPTASSVFTVPTASLRTTHRSIWPTAPTVRGSATQRWCPLRAAWGPSTATAAIWTAASSTCGWLSTAAGRLPSTTWTSPTATASTTVPFSAAGAATRRGRPGAAAQWASTATSSRDRHSRRISLHKVMVAMLNRRHIPEGPLHHPRCLQLSPRHHHNRSRPQSPLSSPISRSIRLTRNRLIQATHRLQTNPTHPVQADRLHRLMATRHNRAVTRHHNHSIPSNRPKVDISIGRPRGRYHLGHPHSNLDIHTTTRRSRIRNKTAQLLDQHTTKIVQKRS
ncbi:unnamed protein product [Acanthoscelides obtectus]|uniref:Uncharacterized protein n=1 Tax=Acanthoscelides obtectus TaxID=200917 RepID=A0A9P0LJF7_ACAOB|nr:unnamed protein product [Acanthoscelides obtectus]CAK1630170.1 hypothetical protein AOBTE_LOCUS6189 [Acanthoscelides obtectus]